MRGQSLLWVKSGLPTTNIYSDERLFLVALNVMTPNKVQRVVDARLDMMAMEKYVR